MGRLQESLLHHAQLSSREQVCFYPFKICLILHMNSLLHCILFVFADECLWCRRNWFIQCLQLFKRTPQLALWIFHLLMSFVRCIQSSNLTSLFSTKQFIFYFIYIMLNLWVECGLKYEHGRQFWSSLDPSNA